MNTTSDFNIEQDSSLSEILQNISAFKPVAFYDKHLDVIRVQSEDISVCEERMDKFVTIYRNAHLLKESGNYDQIIGFSLKGARYLLQKAGHQDSLKGVIKVATLLNEFVSQYPTTPLNIVQDYYLANPQLADLEVDLEDEAIAA